MNGLDKTAQLFRRQRRRWISAVTLMRVGGLLSWRTRVSECRSLCGMRIENKTEAAKNGSKRSFYRYLGRTA